MKTQTARLWTATLLATSLTLFASQGFAQSGNPPTPDLRAQHQAQRAQNPDATPTARQAQRQAMQQEKHQQRMAERQAHLKTMLSITAEQEPAWNAFVARTTPEPRVDRSGERQAMAQLTTPERLDKMQARQAERAAAMSSRIAATRSFYSALTPDQQKRFDSQAQAQLQRTGMQGKHRHGQDDHQGGRDHRNQPGPNAPHN